jgi:tRNA (mo5U34)-methyltransferase
MIRRTSALEQQVQALGPWFHNLRLPADDEVQTAPDHPLGDFPSNFWRFFQQVLPGDLSGKSVLDIGCNAGFYSFELKRRGAARVLGIDHDPHYLAQARFAREVLELPDVEFRQLEVYDVDQLGEQFDLVLFLGVLYHLRHPLYALEKVAGLVRGQLLFQTMERGAWEVAEFAADYPITERDIFFDERFPRMYFIERSYAGDPTNWWVPNPAASLAMLRSVGLEVAARPCHEVYLCQPVAGSAAARSAEVGQPASDPTSAEPRLQPSEPRRSAQ